jgi:hypothetical protein
MYPEYKTMQREILHGVPYLVDKSNKLYTWDLNPASSICIGTYDAVNKRAVVDADAKERLAPLIQEWRQQQQSRPRKPLPPPQPS